MTDEEQTGEAGLLESTAGQTYVVQQRQMIVVSESDDMRDERPFWHDVATVTVPARTRRATVLTMALAQAGIEEADAGAVRVLDFDSAEVWGQETVTNPQTVWRPGGSV